jgi:hypothetical protein
MAWRRGDEDVDAQTGAFVIAEFVLLVRGALLSMARAKKKR